MHSGGRYGHIDLQNKGFLCSSEHENDFIILINFAFLLQLTILHFEWGFRGSKYLKHFWKELILQL